MTRDEAIEKLRAHPSWEPMTDHAIKAFVDGAAIFGLLKLDEPKSVEDEARRWLHDSGHFPGVVDVLLTNGFKIVKA